MSLRDAILARKPNERVVETKAGPVLVRGLTLAAKDATQNQMARGESWRPYALLYCAFDPETKQPLFTAQDLGDLHDVPVEFECIIDAILDLSVLSPEDEEELEGN